MYRHLPIILLSGLLFWFPTACTKKDPISKAEKSTASGTLPTKDSSTTTADSVKSATIDSNLSDSLAYCKPFGPGDSIEYCTNVQLFCRTNIDSTKEVGVEIGPGYIVGRFISGQYENYKLVYATADSFNAPSKGGDADPDPTYYFRFALKDDTLVSFIKISRAPLSFDLSAFNKIGFKITRDDTYDISYLGYREQISGPKKGQVLTLKCEEKGTINPEKTTFIFHDLILGDVFLSPSTYYKFEIGRPDRTVLWYEHIPYVNGKTIRWLNGETKLVQSYGFEAYHYFSGGAMTCSECYDVVSTIKDDELIVSGKTNTNCEIYEYRDKEDLRDFYSKYTHGFDEAHEYMDDSSIQKLTPMNFDSFIASHPIIYWKDAFDRMIQGIDEDARIPSIAEPIIYVYSKTSEPIDISLGPEITAMKTDPPYSGSWRVRSDSTSRITDLKTGKQYTRLFWEGTSFFFPQNKHGYVVDRDKIEDLFTRVLPQMGLQGREVDEFIKAWLPRFYNAPFYFISFYDQSYIDQLSPLHINPKPDVMIRILMEYRPLDREIPVISPIIKAPPKRAGKLVVIEWGGLLYQESISLKEHEKQLDHSRN